MSLRKVQRFTQADVDAIASRRNGSKAAPDVAPQGSPRVPSAPSSAAEAGGTGSRDETAVGGTEGYLMLPYPVPLNRAYRNFKGRMVMSAEAREWKRNAAAVAWEYGMGLIGADCPVAVDLILHPRMNKDGSASKTRQDLDAIFKLALDALNGVGYSDDKQVHKLSALIGDPVEGGALSVRVQPICA